MSRPVRPVLMASILKLQSGPLPWSRRRALAATRWIAAFGGRRLPGHARRLAWREVANGLEALSGFFLFIPPPAGLDAEGLAAAARRARAEDPHRALWTVEALGHSFATTELRAGRSAEEIGESLGRAELDAADRVLIEAGSVWCCALEQLARPISDETVVERAFEVSRAMLGPVADEATANALGVAVRGFHPHRTAGFDAVLRARDPGLAAAFWHGAGRALYFALPRWLSPRLIRRGLECVLVEPPDEESRGEAMAGFAGALTLANLRDPQVIESWLEADLGAEDTSAALADGVGTAAAVFHAFADPPTLLEPLAAHQASSATREAWARSVRDPVERVLALPRSHVLCHWHRVFRRSSVARIAAAHPPDSEYAVAGGA